MNRPFTRELIWTNYLYIGAFVLIIIASGLYYGADRLMWIRALALIALLVFALLLKIRRIRTRDRELDERAQYITYRAVSIGFYFFLLAVLWFFAKELIVDDQLSPRTYVELLAGLTGYAGSYLVLRRKY